jgi:hypothetical protein
MSNEMRKLIDLIEDKQFEAEILNEAPLSPLQKAAATGLALGSLAGGTMADEPTTQMDPGANPVAGQSVERSLDPSFGKIITDPKYYPTTGHHKVANNLVQISFKKYEAELNKLEEIRQKKVKWQMDSGKIDIDIFPNTSNPYSKAYIQQKDIVNQARYDLRAVMFVMERPGFIERYADNPNKASGRINPAVGRKAGVAALKLYLQKSQQYEAPASAERNVPK